MSFSERTPRTLCYKKQDCVSLQVQRSVIKRNYIYYCQKTKCIKANFKTSYLNLQLFVKNINSRKRMFPFTSGKIKGGITVEAAIVMAAFIYVTVAVLYFMLLINFEMKLQLAMNNVSVDMSKKVFYAGLGEEIIERIKDKSPYNNDVKEVEENNDKLEEIVSDGYMYMKVAKEVGIENMITPLVDMSKSSYNEITGVIDIVAKYNFKIPYLAYGNHIPIAQRSMVKTWTGSSIKEDVSKVYITETGSVYHISKECGYLEIGIEEVGAEELTLKRNHKGGKYKACGKCCKAEGQNANIVYITSYGKQYHSTLTCSGLTRKIIVTDISKVGSRNVCGKCGGNTGD